MNKYFSKSNIIWLVLLILVANPIIGFAESNYDMLFDFAEKKYQHYFSPSGATTFPVVIYLARYYSGSNNYIGTKGNDVYVYGDVFGGLLKVGQIGDFISSTSTGDSVANSNALFDFAEKNYPQYFSPPGAVTTPGDIYLARYYPGTKTYLGTKENDVYIYGDVFGGLLKVGQISDFISIQTKVDTLNPTQASSGTEVTISGENFNQSSKVLFGGQSITPEFVSENQLHFIVPFGLNSANQLVPFTPGQTTVKVDNSNPVNLLIVDLPTNPNASGVVLTNSINSAFQQLSSSLADFQSASQQIVNENSDSPSALRLLNNLASLASGINTNGASALISKINTFDPTTLSTLERALLNANSTANTAASTKMNSMAASTDPSSPSFGDSWLASRQNYVAVSRALSLHTQLAKICVSGLAVLGEIAAAVCASFALADSVSSVITEAMVAHRYGTVRKIILLVSNLTSDQTGTDGSIAGESLYLHVDNVNNNDTNPTNKAKTLPTARLDISHKLDIGKVMTTLTDIILKLNEIKYPVPEWLSNLVTNWISDQINPGDYFVVVDTAVLRNDLTYEFYDHSFVPSFSESPCAIHESNNNITLQIKNMPSAQWLFAVPDQGEVETGTFNIGDCKIRLAEEYRMKSEKDVAANINFYVRRYSKITVNIIGDGYITYDLKTVSGNTKCYSGTSPCTEYFDLSLQASSQLTLSSSSSAIWSGSGVNCTQGSTCSVILDRTNANVPNITVEINPPITVNCLGCAFIIQDACTGQSHTVVFVELPFTWRGVTYNRLPANVSNVCSNSAIFKKVSVDGLYYP